MLTLRRDTDYAMQVLKFLGKNKRNIASLRDISESTKISFLFLQKIIRRLRFAKLVESVQGSQGGYFLTMPLEKITLKQVIEIMEGECAILDCLRKKTKNECVKSGENCSMKNKFKKINKQFNDILIKTKISDL
jgi:Rrf2 family protein